DSLQGGNGADQNLEGEAGNDTLVAGGGDRQDLFGGNDADSLQGGNGDDQLLYGQAGNDTVVGGTNNDWLDGGSEDDALNGGAGNDTLLGGQGNDLIQGGAGNDSLSGGDGADTLDGGDPAGGLDDTLAGGLGNDFYIAPEAFLFDTGGNDTVSMLGGGVATISATAGDLDGNPGIEAVDLAGTGRLLGLTAEAVMRVSDTDVLRVYGSGNDSLVFEDEASWTRVATDVGFVTFTTSTGGNATVIASESLVPALSGPTPGDDTLSGTSGADTIDLLAGNDSYTGLDGSDSILGDAGNDTLSGGNGADTLNGGAGDDLLMAGAGNDRLFGEGGNDSFLADSIAGSPYDVYFDGGAGDDVFRLYEGADTVIGGAGVDRVEFLSGNQTINLAEIGSDQASGIDHIVLAGANQQLLLSANDVLRLTDSSILRVSGETDNAIDTTDGGWVQGESDGAFTTFTNGTVTVIVADNLLADEEVGQTLSGTEGPDTISLGAGSDSYLGLGGADSVLGNDGDDTILGGDGGDTIYGGAGDDSISVCNGDDRLYGGLGNDTIDAGAGSGDRIRYDDLDSLSPVTVVIENSGSSSGFNRATVSTAAQGTDSIMGFEILTTTTGNDHITVNSVATANTALYVFAHSGNDTIIFNTTDNAVFADYQHGSTLGGVTADLTAGYALDPFGTDSLMGARNINGSEQADTVLGSSFNDRFRGRGGDDYFDGRGGSDMADYSHLTGSTQSVSINLAAERAYSAATGNDTLISVEEARGGAGNDTIIGSSADNLFRGGSGSDFMDGGDGTGDTADYSNIASSVTVNLLNGRANDGANRTDTIAGCYLVCGGSAAD
ncbi:MAG: beta strand repeat-containing protein, partial [bacterium]